VARQLIDPTRQLEFHPRGVWTAVGGLYASAFCVIRDFDAWQAAPLEMLAAVRLPRSQGWPNGWVGRGGAVVLRL
jgi:hypothetical protein